MDKYKIIISKQETIITPQERGEYCILERQYCSSEEYVNMDRDERKAWKSIDNQDKQFEKAIYGYLEPKNKSEIKTVVIYEQILEDLNVTNVIKAALNIKP